MDTFALQVTYVHWPTHVLYRKKSVYTGNPLQNTVVVHRVRSSLQLSKSTWVNKSVYSQSKELSHSLYLFPSSDQCYLRTHTHTRARHVLFHMAQGCSVKTGCHSSLLRGSALPTVCVNVTCCRCQGLTLAEWRWGAKSSDRRYLLPGCPDQPKHQLGFFSYPHKVDVNTEFNSFQNHQ